MSPDDAGPDAASAGSRWILAARPHTLPAAVAPVLVGTGVAIRDGAFRWDVLVITLAAALAIQVGVNFANDVADAAKGADTDSRIGPARAVASGRIRPGEMWRAIGVVFGFATLCGVYLTWVAGPVIIAIGVASLVAALGYTNGPLPYGYHGLGEVSVFVFFGLVATVGTRFAYDGSTGTGAWTGGVVMGLLAAAILVANNTRDLDTDRAANKRTLAVMLGRSRARILYIVLMVSPFAVIAIAAAADGFSKWSLIALVVLPFTALPIKDVLTETSGPPLIKALKTTGQIQLAVAIALLATIPMA